MQEARHHGAGRPIPALTRHRADQRISIRRKRESAVDPCLDAHVLDGRIALETQHQFVLDPVQLFLKQLFAIVPGRAVHRPVFVFDLVNADEDALLVLPHIGEAFEVDRHRHLEIGRCDFGNGVGDQVMVLQGRDGKFYPCHAADLLGPEPGGVDHVFAGDRALVGHNLPALGGLVQRFDLDAFVILRPALFCSGGIGLHRAGCVDIAFAVGPHRAEHTIGRHDRAALLRFLGRQQFAIIDADRLEDAVIRLQPFPAVGRAGQCQAARHVQPDVLT